MTEFQGWLLLAMLAFIVAMLSRVADLPNTPMIFAVIGWVFGMVGFARWLFPARTRQP